MKPVPFVLTGLVAAQFSACAGGLAKTQTVGRVQQAPAIEATVVTTFDRTIGQLPEGITVPSAGPNKNTIFVSIIPHGTVMKIVDGTATPFARIADPTDRIAVGLASDDVGNMYWAIAATGAGGTAQSGLYRIPVNGGVATPLSDPTVPMALPNAITVIGRSAYWTDAILGRVYLTDTQTGATSLWSDDPLLAGRLGQCGGTPFPAPLGANGITHFGNTIYVANSDFGRIVSIPINANGSAGAAATVAESCVDFHGLDGIQADSDGTLLATRQPTSSILRVTENGGHCIVYAGRPLDGPASDFLWKHDGRRDLLVTNSTAGSQPGGPGPSLVALSLSGHDC